MDMAKLTAVKDDDANDHAMLDVHLRDYAVGVADRLPGPLDVLREGLSGCQMTRLGPSLQAATRGLWTRVWWTGVGA
jgi:hypothetical protein